MVVCSPKDEECLNELGLDWSDSQVMAFANNLDYDGINASVCRQVLLLQLGVFALLLTF